MQDAKLIIKLKGNPQIITKAPPSKKKINHKAVRASKTSHSVALRYSRVF